MNQKEKTGSLSGFSHKWFSLLGFTFVTLISFFQTANAELPPDLNEARIPIKAKRALIYRGAGACPDGCAESAFDMALRFGLDAVYVGPTELNEKSTDAEQAALFKDVAVWIQPGGKSRTVMAAMNTRMKNALRDFVKNGGGYVGFCAGAFSATPEVGTTGVRGFDIFPGRTVLYKGSTSVMPITWNGKKRMIYWQGGPYIQDLPVGKARATAYYPNGKIASAKSVFGKGKLYVTGLHPEAPQWWRDSEGLKDSDGLDYDLVEEMIGWVLNR